MMIIGAVLIILGFVLAIKILWIIGVVLLVVGAVLYLGGRRTGHPVGGRYWY